MNILIGFLFMIAWWLLIYFYKKLWDLFGKWWFAEEYLWWTDQWYIIIWFLLFVLWLLAIFWVVNLSR